MLNAIWAVMILLAVLYGAASGHMSDVTNAALDSAGEAISLCITMAGVVALWMGLMEIAQKAGLIEKLTRGITPFLRFMFPRIPKEHPAREYIATNIIANILGLGWACTPHASTSSPFSGPGAAGGGLSRCLSVCGEAARNCLSRHGACMMSMPRARPSRR